MDENSKFTLPFDELTIEDVPQVGGKNASLGEMISTLSKKGVPVPGGYAITAAAYRFFIASTGLQEFIKESLDGLNTKNLTQLSVVAEKIRQKIIATPFPEKLESAIKKAHQTAEKKYGSHSDFAVRSSATAEDLPGASFAGEHETYLNVRGFEDILLAAKKAMASLFTDRAISYRVDKHFDHFKVALSVGIQKMVRSDLACSGIMFSLDTESGFKDVVLINGSWGLGEMVVQGAVTPDEFIVYKKTLNQKTKTNSLIPFSNHHFEPIISRKLGVKNRKMVYSTGEKPTKIIETSSLEQTQFVLTNKEILKLATWAVEIEKHYSEKNGKWTPMDMEWAKDGKTGELFIVQARPETIHAGRDLSKIKEYVRLGSSKELLRGASVGNKIATGKVRVILTPEGIKEFKAGEVLVTVITDPDWEPIMKIASAIVTDKGGRTSHAAIVSRELGIPCIVGSEIASKTLKTGQMVTIDTTGSEGIVFEGELKFKIDETDIKKLPQTKTKVMVNIATPDTAFEKSFLPNQGVGLAREEFIIASNIGIHPEALINFSTLTDSLKNKINQKTTGWDDKLQFYIDNLSYGIAKIAAAFHPNEVLVRLSDFKTNEYRTLLGGDLYEPEEENPMIGWRGASRYYSPDFAKSFELEIEAFKKVRQLYGLTNAMVLVPFCRTPEEGKKVIDLMEKHGLSRKKDPLLHIYVMCEIPSNVILADQFLDIFDGMSIGSNDLTQLTLGIDRDGNEKIRSIANENDESVKELIRMVIKKCLQRHKYIGICGQAPSDYPDFAAFLVKEGIDSISLNPDTVVKTLLRISKEEQK
jgi:pyruvate,water dikinase